MNSIHLKKFAFRAAGPRPLWVVALALAAFLLPATGAGARTVVDQVGRKVTVPDHPRRVVALAPSITEIVYALNAQNLLAGVTRYSDYPKAAKALPQVGSYVHLDLEKIVSLSPDLCIAVKDGNPKEVSDRLTSLGIPVYAVDPRDLAAVLETVLKIGRLLATEPRAEALVADMRRRIDRVKNRVATVKSRPRVFYQLGISPIVSVGTDTFAHELIEMAGGENLAAGPVVYPRFSREQVLAMAPEVFIITSMARGEVFERIRDRWRQWPQIPAVRDDRIFLVDSNLFDRASPRLVDGLELLARIIHPELFERKAP